MILQSLEESDNEKCRESDQTDTIDRLCLAKSWKLTNKWIDQEISYHTKRDERTDQPHRPTLWPLSQDDDLHRIGDEYERVNQCQRSEDIESKKTEEFIVETLISIGLQSREPDHHTNNRSSDDPYIAIDCTLDDNIEEILDRCDTRSDTSPKYQGTDPCDDDTDDELFTSSSKQCLFSFRRDDDSTEWKYPSEDERKCDL